jgi:hypothetical protein
MWFNIRYHRYQKKYMLYVAKTILVLSAAGLHPRPSATPAGGGQTANALSLLSKK